MEKSSSGDIVSEKSVDIAKIEYCDIGFDDHGVFMMFASFKYDSDRYGSQGLGYVIDLEFIKRFIYACGVEKLSECKGKIVKVEHTDSNIIKIIPLFEDGKTFDIELWSKELLKLRK